MYKSIHEKPKIIIVYIYTEFEEFNFREAQFYALIIVQIYLFIKYIMALNSIETYKIVGF